MLSPSFPVSAPSVSVDLPTGEPFDPRLADVKDGFTRRAKQLRSAGAYREALELLWQGLNIHPEHPRILGSLATVYLQMGEYDRAMTYVERALNVVPISEVAIHLKARLLELKGEIEQSRRWYREVLRINPNHEGAVRAIARLEHASEPEPTVFYGEEGAN